jgi:imidazolonepropionase
MNELPKIDNAFLIIKNGIIEDYGSMQHIPAADISGVSEVIDAENKFVFPAFCDSHTHIVFPAWRDEEFLDKINGLSYEEIATRGGGILNSARKMQQADSEMLFDSAIHRLDEIQQSGTGAVEIKSGYGLTLDSEIKMLKVIQRLKQTSPLTIKSTFLGAHAFPDEYKSNKDEYVKLVVDKMLPYIADHNLADFIDVFCEKNYFSVEQTEKIMEAGERYGLKSKIHVNQFNAMGGIAKAVAKNAISVDHLEVLADEDIQALANSSTIATLLPGCSFFLRLPYANAKKLIENNVAVALASDYNPGSAPSGNLTFTMSLAAIQMQMTPEQIINALTINGAYAMNLGKTHGSITKGKKANIILTKEANNLASLPYRFGRNWVDKTYIFE